MLAKRCRERFDFRLRQNFGQPRLHALELLLIWLDQSDLTEVRITIGNQPREFARACAGVDEMMLAIQSRQRQHKLTIMLRLALTTGSPSRVVQIVPIGMFPRLVHKFAKTLRIHRISVVHWPPLEMRSR